MKQWFNMIIGSSLVFILLTYYSTLSLSYTFVDDNSFNCTDNIIERENHVLFEYRVLGLNGEVLAATEKPKQLPHILASVRVVKVCCLLFSSLILCMFLE